MHVIRSKFSPILYLAAAIVLAMNPGHADDVQFVASLDEIRTLRLAGKLSDAQTKAEHRLNSADDADDAIALHLELAKIHDRIGLHNNTRPVAAALLHIDAAHALLLPDHVRSSAPIELAYGDYYYRAEMRDREFIHATRHVNAAIALFRVQGDTRGEADAVHRLGLIYLQKRDLDLARDWFDESLRLDQINGEREWFRGEYERHIGFVYQLSDDIESALPHYKRSLEARINSGAIDASLFAATTLAGALIEVGQLDKAARHVQYALAIAEQIGSPEGRVRANRVLERIEAAKGHAPVEAQE